MDVLPGWLTRDRAAVVAGLLAPFLVTLLLVPFRDNVNNTNAALVLVLVIVAVAANGNRLAGALAALSTAAWFDFFLTQPYQRFSIDNRNDVETTVLLLAVGVGVSEIALWGRRQHARAERDAAYLRGIRAAAEAMASPQAPDNVIRVVAGELTRVLGLLECRFEYGVAGLGRPARLQHDGHVEWQGKVRDVERDGWPPDVDVELLVQSNGVLVGRYLLRPAPDSTPTVTQRLVAVTMADQVGTALL